jgi:hypothetical protein
MNANDQACPSPPETQRGLLLGLGQLGSSTVNSFSPTP